jgi:FAD/FMN-containing dehydrogenase
MNVEASLLTADAIERLQSKLAGRVIRPGEPDYDAARTVFYGGIDRRPSLIVRVADASDVREVIAFAREGGLELAIRSGGHSIPGFSVTDGGVVLDLSKMRALTIDLKERTAWAETGLTAGAYTSAASAHGLATPFGDTGSVGIGGITLGGGVGYLARKVGLTIDSLLAADVVTADGQLRRVDAQTHPELFWAIRGGGGNFGVATRFQYRLHEVPTVVGGLLILPATADVIASFIAEAEAAPEELSTIVNIMSAPPLPFLPPEYHGRLVVMALLAYAGAVDAGERAVAPFRALATPLVDMIKAMPMTGLYPPDDPTYHPVGISQTLFVDGVDRGVAQTILDRLDASTAPMRVAQLRVLGGAVSRVPVEATAYAHRDARIMANVAALGGPPEEAASRGAWVAELAAVLSQGRGRAYVNFLADEGQARVHDAYPGSTWDRLESVKTRYDPDNVFHLNQNIPPARR